MRSHHHNPRPYRAACALAAMACILLVFAAAAVARPIDFGPVPPQRSDVTTAPMVIKETVVKPGRDGGPSAIVFALIGVGAATITVLGGYVGGRIAVRSRNVQPT